MIIIILMALIPALIIVACVSIFSFIRAFIDRILFYKRIDKLCKAKKYKVSFARNPLASLLGYSAKPDIVIKTSAKNYLVRIITCNDRFLFYKFPSPEWYVSYERIISVPINPTGRFKHLPPFKEEYYNKSDCIENKLVMVFAPCMPKISYLTKGSIKREISESNDTIGGWSVYSVKDLLNKL